MAYTVVPTVVPGQTWTAANHNTYIKDNFAAGVPDIFTAAGDMVYATGADAAARLALVSGGILIGGANAPQYSSPQYAEVATSESTASTSYTDLSTAGPSISVTTPNGFALILFSVLVANSTSGARAICGVGVDAADPASGQEEAQWENESTGAPNPTVPMFAWITGLSAASHTFKLRYKTTAGTQFFARRKIWGIGL